MDYRIIINLIPEKINNIEYFFWYIADNNSNLLSNYGHGWATTIIKAAKDAEAYYQKNAPKD